MDVTHRVRVPAPLDEAWQALQEPARLAGVLPGTTVDAAAGDTFSGSMKLKLGSALLTLVGDGRYVSRDAGARRVVVRTTGTDRRGDAAVEATHTVTLAGVGDGRAETDVTVATSMTWSGRPARLGDGVVADTVDRVLDTTAGRIAARVADGLPWVPRHRGGGVARRRPGPPRRWSTTRSSSAPTWARSTNRPASGRPGPVAVTRSGPTAAGTEAVRLPALQQHRRAARGRRPHAGRRAAELGAAVRRAGRARRLRRPRPPSAGPGADRREPPRPAALDGHRDGRCCTAAAAGCSRCGAPTWTTPRVSSGWSAATSRPCRPEPDVLEATARREAREEVGLDLDDVALTYLESELFTTDAGVGQVTVAFLAAAPADQEPVVADPAELTAVGWWTPDEAAADDRCPAWLPALLRRAEAQRLREGAERRRSLPERPVSSRRPEAAARP